MRGNTRQGFIEIAAVSYGVKTKCMATLSCGARTITKQSTLGLQKGLGRRIIVNRLN